MITNDRRLLTEEQIRFFHEEGYLCLDQISPAAEVEKLIGIYDRLFSVKAGRNQGAHFDMVGHDKDEEPPVSPQIINPVLFAPELKETEFRANAMILARQLLGPEARYDFEHAILKPPKIGAPTPWHQDEAFRRDHPPGYQEISVWMPLQDVDETNGCLEYLPGSHRKHVLRHASPGNDPLVHALECVEDFEAAKAVACPLPAGGCVIHHCRTLHHSTANRSSMPRRAYILGFAVPPEGNPRLSPGFPWNEEKMAPSKVRKLAWRRRGGFVVEVMRKIRARLTR
ncbi:MAG TPA: phytanoyl-CoA dioxygenase family protein [Chthoniobacterales bacterium]